MAQIYGLLFNDRCQEYNQSAMPLKFLSRLSQALQKNKTAPTASLGVGTLVKDRYRLEAEIGRGGMGIVYRARDLSENRDVAVKIVNLEHANALTRQQFLQEMEIQPALHHPHIVAVYETGTIEIGAKDPSLFLVMEWVSGPSLDRLRRLTYTKILEIGKQICEALEYIHQQGFVYRDLKPGNVLLELRGFRYFVKLTDFGLARRRGVAYAESESSLAGTTFYLAPELIAGQLPDVASDLYALGATLYELITGRPPFIDFDEKTILLQHQESLVAPPAQSRGDVPPALEATVLRLLAKIPQDRFASAQEVCDALERILVDRRTSAKSGNLPQSSIDLQKHMNDLAQLRKMLETNRLVTVLRDPDKLALAVAKQLADQFQDGVWWVDLEPINHPTHVLDTVSAVLGIYLDPHRSLTVSLVENLHEKNLMILLNRCEQLVAACAQLADTLLSTCPDVYILAISQQPLNLALEACYPPASSSNSNTL